MLALLTVSAFLSVLGLSQAAPSCTADATMPCIMPVMMFSQSPEGQEISRLQGREDEITEAQLVTVCRLAQSVTTCLADYLTRCVPADATDVHTLARGTVKLMKVCDKPDMGSKTKTLLTCGKSLKTNPDYVACSNTGKDKLHYLMGAGGDPFAGMEILQSGRVLKDLCCTMKQMGTCMAPQIATCSSQAQDIHRDVTNAVVEAFGCEAKTAEGCPA